MKNKKNVELLPILIYKSKQLSSDLQYMYRCIELAKKGVGNVAPNPMVGCVIVKNGEIISEGYHQKLGGMHAEANAIRKCKNKFELKGATMYVNLEPCSHFGKTPPCAKAIIDSKLKKVVIGMQDPNPLVSGKGIKLLIENGIEIICGVLEKECKELNKRFVTFHQKKRPYIILKWAQTEDGFIDSIRNKDMQPLAISNSMSNQISHNWRAKEHSIFIGKNTLIFDNPSLTTRNIFGNNPLRICIGKYKSELSELSFFNDENYLFLNTGEKNSDKRVLSINENPTINEILDLLYRKNIQSIIVEGGRYLLQKFIDENIWDEIRIIQSNFRVKKGIKVPYYDSSPKSLSYVGSDIIEYHIP